MVKQILQQTESLMMKTIEKMKQEFSTIRLGKIDVTLLENLKVQYENTQTLLKQIAAIAVIDPKTVDIKPWDKNVLQAIEKAIYQSSLGLTPMNDGTKIRLKLPPVTEERKMEIIKNIRALAENFKTSIRNERRTAHEQFRKLEQEKKISKDDKFRGENELQKLTDTYTKKIEEILKQKEKEILES